MSLMEKRFGLEPKVDGIVYEKVDYVPHGGHIGRGGPARYYKYYIDKANRIIYFYPFRVTIFLIEGDKLNHIQSERIEFKYRESQLLKHPSFLRESIKVVPSEIY